MNVFIIEKSNFVTKAMICKSLKNAKSEAGRRVYRKASMPTEKIIINSVDEMLAYASAIRAYNPQTETEKRILAKLRSVCTCALKKRNLEAVNVSY